MLLRCPKLTPLQSRFIASFGTLLLLGLVFWSLSNPHFAYAAELGSEVSGQPAGGEDHNWHRIEEYVIADDGMEQEQNAGREVKRAITPQAVGANNAPNQLNIQPGNTTIWIYSSALLSQPAAPAVSGLPSDPGVRRDVASAHAELRKRQDRNDSKTVYVSINTCLQPMWNSSGVQTQAPPQLTLYVATSADNTDVGPNGDATRQVVQPLEQGFANVSVTGVGNTYIAVSAPTLPEGFSGVWNYELAVSTDAYYHAAETVDPFLYLVDTDNAAALLVTNNLTQQDSSSDVFKAWMSLNPPPFIMFGANVNHLAMLGMINSYCGWANHNQIAGSQKDPAGENSNVQMGMITRGLGNKPKEQIYVTNLNSSTGYVGVLAQPGNSTASGSGVVGGGGKIWAPVSWQTKTDGNCALIFNLSFCDEVAYAVPTNPNNFNFTGLAALYDGNTSAAYQNFNYSLQQIPCNTTADRQYSTIRNCDDCAAAYKEWLCATSIPRCEDFSNPADHLQIRNVGQPFYNNNSYLPQEFLNSSYIPMSRAPTIDGSMAYQQTFWTAMATNSTRNPALIGSVIQPGPYKEVKPCEDLCYGLVQSCPAALGFQCPWPGRGLEVSYGKRSANGDITCSYLGAFYSVSGATDLSAPVWRAFFLAVLVGLVLGVA